MYCIVVTTCRCEDEEKIVNVLLSSQLAACINSFSVDSTYIWKGKIEKDRERTLFIKTKMERYREVEEKIKEFHSYDVPEIICFEIKNGDKKYLQWIEEVIK